MPDGQKPRKPYNCVARRKANAVVKRAEAAEDRKQGRRVGTGVDPTTSDVIYEDDEVEFIMAVDRYKREKQRPFPTNREILWVLKALGYAKPGPAAT